MKNEKMKNANGLRVENIERKFSWRAFEEILKKE
jgi:hypothetical protein